MFRCPALLNVSTFSSSLCGPTLQILEAPEIRKNTQDFNPLLLKGTISRAMVGRVFNFWNITHLQLWSTKVKETHISHTSHIFSPSQLPSPASFPPLSVSSVSFQPGVLEKEKARVHILSFLFPIYSFKYAFPSEKADNSTVLDVALVLVSLSVLPARQAAAQVTPSTTSTDPFPNRSHRKGHQFQHLKRCQKFTAASLQVIPSIILRLPTLIVGVLMSGSD